MVFFLEKIKFPGQKVDFGLWHVIHILKAVHLRIKMGYLEAILVHPVRRQNFAGKWHLTNFTTSETVHIIYR